MQGRAKTRWPKMHNPPNYLECMTALFKVLSDKVGFSPSVANFLNTHLDMVRTGSLTFLLWTLKAHLRVC